MGECRGGRGRKKGGAPRDLIPLTLPEVRRLLLADRDPPLQLRFHLWWSTFRREHQAMAQRSHRARHARDQPALDGPAIITDLVSTVPELNDARWEQIGALVPLVRRYGEETPLDQRTILAGILWVARTGRSWRDLPRCFGYWETVYAYYSGAGRQLVSHR